MKKEKTIKKSFIALAAFTALLAAAPLSGCHLVAGNYPGFGFVSFIKTENGFFYYDLEISTAKKTYRTLSADEMETYRNGNSDDIFLGGGTAPRRSIFTPTGFEGVTAYIEAQEIDGNEYSVVDTNGIVSDNILTGWVNVYKDTAGYLSGGGQYAAEEIDHAITFTYDAQSDEFNVTNTVDGAMIVSFYGDTVLYWKKKSYYSYNLVARTETFLTKDKAYDSGLLHQSRAYIVTDGRYALFELVKAGWSKETTYVYLYDYEDNSFSQLTEE